MFLAVCDACLGFFEYVFVSKEVVELFCAVEADYEAGQVDF